VLRGRARGVWHSRYLVTGNFEEQEHERLAECPASTAAGELPDRLVRGGGTRVKVTRALCREMWDVYGICHFHGSSTTGEGLSVLMQDGVQSRAGVGSKVVERASERPEAPRGCGGLESSLELRACLRSSFLCAFRPSHLHYPDRPLSSPS
jgi:hypothetical protein